VEPARQRPDEMTTPTGLQPSAQRCHDAGVATLGKRTKTITTLKGLNPGVTGGGSNPFRVEANGRTQIF